MFFSSLSNSKQYEDRWINDKRPGTKNLPWVKKGYCNKDLAEGNMLPKTVVPKGFDPNRQLARCYDIPCDANAVILLCLPKPTISAASIWPLKTFHPAFTSSKLLAGSSALKGPWKSQNPEALPAKGLFKGGQTASPRLLAAMGFDPTIQQCSKQAPWTSGIF